MPVVFLMATANTSPIPFKGRCIGELVACPASSACKKMLCTIHHLFLIGALETTGAFRINGCAQQ